MANTKLDVGNGLTYDTKTKTYSGGTYNTQAANSVLKVGSTGSDVAALQKALQARGYNVGPIDGVFGAQTYNALRQFQRDSGITADGIAGNQTWGALSGASTAKASTPISTPKVTMTYTPASTPASTPAPSSSISTPSQTVPTIPSSPTNSDANQFLQGLMDAWMQAMQGPNQQILDTLQSIAQQQAQAAAQQQKMALQNLIDQLNTQQQTGEQRIQNQLRDAQASVEDQAFQKWLAARQEMANRGLAGSGLASDQDTRLLLQRQQALAGIYRDALTNSYDLESTIRNNLNNYYQQMAAINPDEQAQAIFQQLYQQALEDQQKNAALYAQVLGQTMPYAWQTANNSANNMLKTWEDLGYMPDPVTGQLVKTLDSQKFDWEKLLNQAQMTGYWIDPVTGQVSNTLSRDQLLAQMAHWANQDSISAQELALNRDKFLHQQDMDNIAIQQAEAAVADDKVKAQIKLYADDISHLYSLANTQFSTNGKADPDIFDQIQKDKQAIAALMSSNPSAISYAPN